MQETRKEIKEFQQIKNRLIKKALLKGVHELAARLSNSIPMTEKKMFLTKVYVVTEPIKTRLTVRDHRHLILWEFFIARLTAGM